MAWSGGHPRYTPLDRRTRESHENNTKKHRSESCFRGVDRIKLLMSILSAPTRDGGAGLSDGQMKIVKDCLKSLASSRE